MARSVIVPSWTSGEKNRRDFDSYGWFFFVGIVKLLLEVIECRTESFTVFAWLPFLVYSIDVVGFVILSILSSKNIVTCTNIVF